MSCLHFYPANPFVYTPAATPASASERITQGVEGESYLTLHV